MAEIVENFDRLAEAARLPSELALRECAPLVARQCDGLADRVSALLASAPAFAHEPRFETLAWVEGSYTLQLFVWPRGASTPIHDHTSWGIYVCLAGQLGEERFVRLDDSSHFGTAHLRHDWSAVWRPSDRSTLLPYAGGIHRVRNAGLATAISLHLYGPQLGTLDGRDYDPRRDFVCDRPREQAA
jgi:Cysteine dioxygenase type I